jgi:hypothetical protein
MGSDVFVVENLCGAHSESFWRKKKSKILKIWSINSINSLKNRVTGLKKFFLAST